ncbi:MAG TPA: 4Fe-4S cluster-binding domain-containing protein, partial [Pyrinomonadaceae bacterium]|nr:4Fe-4S cluster-binding domain-containing protein [Pyrinomonadaceae bacterium]
MSKEITFILEPDNGKLTTEVSDISTNVLTDLRDDLGISRSVNCGKPFEGDVLQPIQPTSLISDNSQSIWLYRIYHNSVVDGPGRRSVIQVAGCSIRCPGCHLPETHERNNGRKVSISYVVSEILKEKG